MPTKIIMSIITSIIMSIKTGIIILLAVALLGGCSSTKEEPDLSAEELYALAQESFGKKNWVEAIERLRALEAKYPYGTHAEQAQLDTIYAHYRNNETGLAIASADRFIKLHPTHAAIDYAYYVKGLANVHENDSLFGRFTGRSDLSDRDATPLRDALSAFQDVYTLFPGSRYAADARARARYLTHSLAKHEIAVAKYYYFRDAHVAVVNRAKGLIEEYAESPLVEDALALLVFSYQKMGLNDLSDSARRVLALNFPNSEYLGADGVARLEEKLRNVSTS